MNIGRKEKRALRRAVTWMVLSTFVGLCFIPPGVAVEPKGITGITPVASGGVETAARSEAERVGVWQTDTLRAGHDRVRISTRRFRLGASTPQEQARAQEMNIIYASEEVSLNGKRLTRGVDYVIDYREKIINFTDDVEETALITVKYRWAPKPKGTALRSGISGIAGVTGEAVPVAGIGSGVNAVGVAPTATGANSKFKALTEFRAGEGGPDVRGALLGTNKALSLGSKTQLELTLANSREEAREQDATLRRQQALIMSSSRMALTQETRTRQLGATQGTQPAAAPVKSLLSGEGYKARLTHESGSVQMEANVGALDRDFDAGMANQFAASLNNMGQNYRNFKTTDLLVRDKQEKPENERFRWERNAVASRETGKAITRERMKVALGGKLTYESNQLSIDSGLASAGGLDNDLVARFGLNNAQKFVGTAAEQYKAPPSLLSGIRDKQEKASLALSRNLQASGERRQITDAQGARLLDQKMNLQVGKNLTITQEVQDVDHNFSKPNETGYKNFGGLLGHRHENTQYAYTVNSRLSLTHTEDQRIVNTSGVAGQGTKTKQQIDALNLQLAKGSFQATQTVTRNGDLAAWSGNGKVNMTRTRLLNLSHQLDRNTNLQLTNTETLMRQGGTEQTDRELKSILTTKFKGVSMLSLTRTDKKPFTGSKSVTTNLVCNTDMGLTATYDEMDATNGPTKSRMLLKYSRKLADGLVLTAAHRRVKNWKEDTWKAENPQLVRVVALQDQEKASAGGTDLTLAFTPDKRTSATLWHKILDVKGEGAAKAVGLNLSRQLTDRIAFTASTDRWGTSSRLAGYNQSYGLKFTGKTGQVEMGYTEGRASGMKIKPNPFAKFSLQPFTGMTLTAEYIDRDRETTGMLATKSWSVAQTFAGDGNFTASYLRNPLNNQGQIVPTAKTRYALTSPSRWLKGKGTLTLAYETQDASVDGGALSLAPYNSWGAPFKGNDLVKAEASLNLKPSKHETFLLTYGRLHGYGPNLAGRQGQERCDLNYTREFDADHQLSLRAFVGNPDGSWDRKDLEHYRVDLEYRLRF